MDRIEKDEEREDRIAFDVVADCDDEEGIAVSWFYYVGEQASYPFKARCISEQVGSPLKQDEIVTVTDVSSDSDSRWGVRVLIELAGRTFGVPLAQLEPVDADKETEQIVADWHYWVGRGY